MKWLLSACLAVLLASVVTPAEATHRSTVRTEVMSQNLYIGADLSRLLVGDLPADIFETVLQTDYEARAIEIAEAIDDFNPDLLGLQEVSIITLFDSEGKVLLELDYLQILLDRIQDQGEHYAVGSSVTNADVTLPIDPVVGTFARVIDRDVIIYRTGTTSVSNPRSANFSTNFLVPILGVPVEFTRGFTSVDARVNGQDIRFVNTHLEVEDAPCVTAGGAICQELQAEELVAELADAELPTVLVGDFNAQPGMPAYETIATAGYTDTWTIRYPYNNESGATCCQSETLLNLESQLTQRIDHIFIDSGLDPVYTVTTVVGDWDQRKTPSGLWYSDHGGPWARLYLRNGD